MAISEVWRVRDDSWGWIMPSYCTLKEAAYLVLGEEPANANADHPAKVCKALREMKRAIINNPGLYGYPKVDFNLTPFIGSDTPPENIMVSASFVRKWANHYRVTDFFEQAPEPAHKPKIDKQYTEEKPDFEKQCEILQKWLEKKIESGLTLDTIQRTMTKKEIQTELQTGENGNLFHTGFENFWDKQQILNLRPGNRPGKRRKNGLNHG